MAEIVIGGGNKQRSSNLELYRIICMFLILAHHFTQYFYLSNLPYCDKTIFLNILGMWGKTGINCFLMITGYFMCKSDITIRKFLKLILEVYFYRLTIAAIFFCLGMESLTPLKIVQLISPIWNIETNFVDCFIVFFLTIPFWNILIKNMSKKQHELLLVLLLSIYSILGSTLVFHITFNYVTWFGIIYLISSYIRLYPKYYYSNVRLWGTLTVIFIIMSIASVFAFRYILGSLSWNMVSDSNKFFAVATAVSSFMLIKNIHIPYNRWINMIGGSTFAVLLIHSHSDVMRKWLFIDTMNTSGIFEKEFPQMVLSCIIGLIIVFSLCIIIDRLRILFIEIPLFKWYDKKIGFQRFESFFNE